METIKKIDLPAIGEPLAGGFFCNLFAANGDVFALIVAPKQEGETKGTWGEYGVRNDAIHFGDGVSNTNYLAEKGSAIALFAKGLTINGFSDWYIPSRDEVEMCYRHLKPTQQENYCTFRDGENHTSIPHGHLYTENNPEQTLAAAFQEGGDQAFEDAAYWSSTQCSAYYAFYQVFDDGSQSLNGKRYALRARAVRRLLVIE
jgi:hypothetical protein